MREDSVRRAASNREALRRPDADGRHHTILNSFLESVGKSVEAYADRDLPADAVGTAARYSVFGGGKRLRPALVMASAAAFGSKNEDAVLPIAVAYEYIHTYSLIHDDLPVMDNDEIRRGRAACHIAFDVETAVLAGALLLIKAFEAVPRGPIVHVLERSSGIEGMVGGQALDILGENDSADEEQLLRIHSAKTAALIQGAILSGAMAAGASEEEIETLSDVGLSAGLAFQIIDDLLDVESTAEIMGKPVGRDDARGKRTYPAVIGIDASRARAQELIKRAENGLMKLGKTDTILAYLIQFVTHRRV